MSSFYDLILLIFLRKVLNFLFYFYLCVNLVTINLKKSNEFKVCMLLPAYNYKI